MNKLIRIILLACASLHMGCATTQIVDTTPVESLDLSRYLGTWYEIARFDHWFERDVSHAKATYTLQKNNTIEVINSGLKAGKVKTAVGRAKTTTTPGLLRVSFFGPFYSDYRILWLDKTYEHALVGSSDADSLWILARTPQITPDIKALLLAEATRRGYNIQNLLWVKQDAPHAYQ